MKKNVAGGYTINGLNGVSLYANVSSDNLIIIPEGAGSYFQALYAPGSGLASREVAILDIGFYTTDLTIWNKGNYVTGSARSAKHGVRQVASEVYQHLRQQYRYEGDLWAVDSALEAGCIDIGNKCRSSLISATMLMRICWMMCWPSIIRARAAARQVRSSSVAAVQMASTSSCPTRCAMKAGASQQNPRRANADGAYLFLEQRERAKDKAHG